MSRPDQDAQAEEEVEVCADLLDLARIVLKRQTGCITYKHTNLPVCYDHIPECTVGRFRAADGAIAAIRFRSRHISPTMRDSASFPRSKNVVVAQSDSSSHVFIPIA